MLEDPCERSGRMPTGRVRRRDDPECCARLLALSSLYLITAARKSGSSPSLTTTAPPGQNGNYQPAHGEDLAHRPAACEYSHRLRRASQFSGTLAQFSVATLAGKV